ncbi:MAG: phospho-sugar mutase [Clostridiales bacterium]|nr:phospho-sugar mutase [Clostridiales bacterium]
MQFEKAIEYWSSLDEDMKKEIESITDPKEIEDRFYKNLEFGTGGMRGIMGAGPNRMNRYMIAKATQGYADYLKENCDGSISVAIAYDSRNNSRDFAKTAASVLTANGIKVYFFDRLMPTPVLSFTVRHLSCSGGIVITASHNPKEYNGYKVYDEKGCQFVPKLAKKLIEKVNAIDDIKSIEINDFNDEVTKGNISVIGDSVLDAFIEEVKKQSLYTEKSDLKIVYTPLHGTGNIPVRTILKDMNVSIVKAQELPDGNFSTVRSPNPEEKDALTLAIEQAKEEDADIVVGTDPDCDRIGAAVKHNGDFVLVTGNQMGALLVNFVLGKKKDTLNEKSTLVKTIVTGELGADIAKKYGLNIVNTLTGFKFIGEQMNKYEETGDKEFVIGYEESYGYLVGGHARDKDAVVSAMIICQMAAFYKAQGKTLIDVLESLYAEYGYYLDILDTFVLKGKEGAEQIQKAMTAFRQKGAELCEDIREVEDYSQGIGDLPKENVLKFILSDGSWFAARPSGTEPKLKVYFSVKANDREAAAKKIDGYRSILRAIVEG